MNISSSGRRRLAAALTVPALAASASYAGATPSYADPSPSGDAARDWIVGQLGENDLIYNEQFDSIDYGLSVDTALAALAAGDRASALRVRDALEPDVERYLTGEDYGDAGSRYAGATAKALVLVQRTGGDTGDFRGIDLVSRLESLVGAEGATRGRIADVSTYGDYANTIGQALAVEGLAEADSARADDVTSYLLDQQCDQGFFRVEFPAAEAPDQTCDGAEDPATPSADATALALLSLRSRAAGPRTREAMAKATAWLVRAQQDDGSFDADAAGEASNANSTGLAATALGTQCEAIAAHRAGDYLRTLQVGAGTTGPLAGERGAVAFDEGALARARTDGITTETRDQFRRATAQAVPGLLWQARTRATVSFGRTAKFGRVGKSRTLRVRGVDAGETLCLGDPGAFRPVVGTGGLVTRSVSRNRGGVKRYGATTGPGVATTRITWLDRTRFRVNTKDRVRRGAKQLVIVRGLERGEKVRVFVAGQRVAKGQANARGKYAARFKMTQKPGRTRVKVIGQFFNRKGYQSFRVVR